MSTLELDRVSLEVNRFGRIVHLVPHAERVPGSVGAGLRTNPPSPRSRMAETAAREGAAAALPGRKPDDSTAGVRLKRNVVEVGRPEFGRAEYGRPEANRGVA